MLENVWLIPAAPFVSFFVILFFGKRLPKKGAEVGIAALAIAFALSTIAAVQWIGRPADLTVEAGHSLEEAEGIGQSDDAAEEHGEEEEAGAEGGHAGEGEEAVAGEGGEEAHPNEPIRAPVQREVTWFRFGGITVHAGTHVDGLAIAMLFLVSVVSLMVHIFSTSYMHGDVRFTHYYAGLSLFTTGMFVLVTASNTLQALFGWELMGLCSFMLIGHWWEDKANSDAALKAFFTTRTGDVGLLVGISILFFAAGQTFDIGRINDAALAGDISRGVLIAAAAALLCAVIGKSAQFPLHTWLPDAMAGPTPVSALIHAATMVVAGVYLVARLYGVFYAGLNIADGGWNWVALVGGVTILIAAALAFIQNDIKRVLAYSTVSQLGYMVMALGVGAWTAGIFHLFTHAFFKALLFLGAGSVSHSGSHHSFDMKKDMGGLRKHMPITFATFVIGSLALAGIVPLAGFWSKDEILLGASKNDYGLFLAIGTIGAFMTAAYMARCVWLTFFGEYRGHGHPHESPRTITGPLIVLTVFSVFAGLLNAPGIGLFTEWTNNTTVLTAGLAHHEFSTSVAGISTVVALLGIAVGFLYYERNLGPRGITERPGLARAGYRLLDNRYYLDHLYTGVIVGGIKGPIARGAYWTNQRVIDGVVNGVGIVSRGVANFVYDVVDQKVVDGMVNGAGLSAEEGGTVLRRIQTGRVQQYAALLFGAAAVFAVALVIITN